MAPDTGSGAIRGCLFHKILLRTKSYILYKYNKSHLFYEKGLSFEAALSIKKP